jgi:aryl-alcohol dehydrogenase-like predicted oxidoreductase
MELRKIGTTDLQVSVVGLGGNNFGAKIDARQSQQVIGAALDLGITFFDTADAYPGSEEILGPVLAGRRKEVIIASKFGMHLPGRVASREAVMRAAEGSLQRLGTDYIDLFYLHAPDPTQAIDETLSAMSELVFQGKVRYIGCSNMSAALLMEAASAARKSGSTGFVASEEEYSLLVRRAEDDVIPALRRLRMSLIPYFPLASGLLTGKYQRSTSPVSGTRFDSWRAFTHALLTDKNFDRIEALTQFANSRGHQLVELAVAWLLASPIVPSVIAGATSAAQVKANVAAASWRLNQNELEALNEICPA